MKKCYKYPFDILEIGQCFDAHDVIHQSILHPCIAKQKQYNRYFVVRQIGSKIHRIWRIENKKIISKIPNLCCKHRYKIDKNVPIPLHSYHKKKYPLEQLEIGEFVIVTDFSQNSVHNYNRKKRNQGKKFKTKLISKNKLKIWRVE